MRAERSGMSLDDRGAIRMRKPLLDVDEVAVERACSGVRTALNSEECRDAVEWLIAHGMSQRETAETLHVPHRRLEGWVQRDSYPPIHQPVPVYTIAPSLLQEARAVAAEYREDEAVTTPRRYALERAMSNITNVIGTHRVALLEELHG